MKTKVWHSRLGHMSSKNMELLVKEGFIPMTEVGICMFLAVKKVKNE